jgi:hypothetical protein
MVHPEVHAVLMAHWRLLAQASSTPLPSPGSGTDLPGQVQAQLNAVLGWVKWLGLAAAFAGLFVAAGRMALSHRMGSGGEHMSSLGYIAGSLVLIGSASALIGFFV